MNHFLGWVGGPQMMMVPPSPTPPYFTMGQWGCVLILIHGAAWSPKTFVSSVHKTSPSRAKATECWAALWQTLVEAFQCFFFPPWFQLSTKSTDAFEPSVFSLRESSYRTKWPLFIDSLTVDWWILKICHMTLQPFPVLCKLGTLDLSFLRSSFLSHDSHKRKHT